MDQNIPTVITAAAVSEPMVLETLVKWVIGAIGGALIAVVTWITKATVQHDKQINGVTLLLKERHEAYVQRLDSIDDRGDRIETLLIDVLKHVPQKRG